MTSPVVRKDSQIERECSAAICEEIGDRLRINLARQPDDMVPEHMMTLVDQMAADEPVMPRVSTKTQG